MINSEAITLLKTLSPKELKKFRDFLNSPYHNKNKKLCEIFQELRKYCPSFSGRNFTKERLYKKLYKKEKYSDNTMKRLFWDLKNEIEK